jgi:hypothetical protein
VVVWLFVGLFVWLSAVSAGSQEAHGPRTAAPGLAPAAPSTPAAPTSARPEPEERQRPPGPYDEGRIRVSLNGGSAGTTNNRYFVIGAGLGYFVLDGLEVGVAVESWLGGDPTITKLSPQARYIFHMIPYVNPYFGGFYRHWFIAGGHDDVDTLGGRMGLAIVTGPHMFAGGGVVHEVIVSACADNCSETYPEFFVSLAF